MLFFWDRTAQLVISLPVSCVQAVITDLFKMFFGDMLYQPFDKIHCRQGFRNQLVIFVAVVMECDIFTIIAVNTGSGYDRPAKMDGIERNRNEAMEQRALCAAS